MKARLAGKEDLLTPEQRHLLRKRIDAIVRERLNDRREPARAGREAARARWDAPKPPKQTTPGEA